MAQKQFLFQGFTPQTHVEAVRELLDLPNIQKVLISVAFVNRNGVALIEQKLRATSAVTTVFAGIRNDITSSQGLKLLLETGLTLQTVDTGARGTLFHPKIYLARNAHHARLIIGSANLTLGGMNNNIEAGLVLHCDLADGADKALVNSIENQFDAILTTFPDHIQHIHTAAELDEMQRQGRVIDEFLAVPSRSGSAAKSTSSDGLKRIRLAVQPLAPTFRRPRPPTVAHVANTNTSPTPPTTQQLTATIGVEFETVWVSKALKERDLTIPSGDNTNATGSINLDKGQLPQDVDHRHYFRDEVFQDLVWRPSARTATVEEATATFQLVVKGVSYGEFPLVVHHTISTNTRAYTQKNAMTRLSWGAMKEYVAKQELLERTLTLYRDKVDLTRFTIEID